MRNYTIIWDENDRVAQVNNSGELTVHDAALLAQLQSLNPTSSTIFDTIVVTYTDINKTVISKVEYKLLGAVVKTLTPTFAALTDTWTRS